MDNQADIGDGSRQPSRTRGRNDRAGRGNLSGQPGIDDSRRQSTTRKSAGTNRDRAGSTTCCQHQVLSAMRQCVSLKGILPFHSAFRIRQSWHARPTTQSMPMLRIAGAELLNIVYEQEPHHARVAVYHCQDGGSVAVSKSGRFPRRISSFVCAGNRQHGPKQDDEGRKAASEIGENIVAASVEP